MRSLKAFLLARSFWVFELFAAALAVSWGLALLKGGVLGYMQSYQLFWQTFPEWTWGVLFIIKGSAHIWALVANRRRELFAMIATVFWMFIALMLLGGVGFRTGTICYGLIAIFSALSSIRQKLLKKEGYTSD